MALSSQSISTPPPPYPLTSTHTHLHWWEQNTQQREQKIAISKHTRPVWSVGSEHSMMAKRWLQSLYWVNWHHSFSVGKHSTLSSPTHPSISLKSSERGGDLKDSWKCWRPSLLYIDLCLIKYTLHTSFSQQITFMSMKTAQPFSSHSNCSRLCHSHIHREFSRKHRRNWSFVWQKKELA